MFRKKIYIILIVVGIIIGALFFYYNNTIVFTNSKVINTQKWRPSFSFYYYDSEENGRISSENLIDGLEWMMENGIEYVSINYSGKYEAEELKDWINKHSDKITIYASYNNYSNTLDYPAMYKNVIGVGCNVTKKKDVSVRNNRLIVCDGISLFSYQGNSYMTPYIMIKNNFK